MRRVELVYSSSRTHMRVGVEYIEESIGCGIRVRVDCHTFVCCVRLEDIRVCFETMVCCVAYGEGLVSLCIGCASAHGMCFLCHESCVCGDFRVSSTFVFKAYVCLLLCAWTCIGLCLSLSLFFPSFWVLLYVFLHGLDVSEASASMCLCVMFRCLFCVECLCLVWCKKK